MRARAESGFLAGDLGGRPVQGMTRGDRLQRTRLGEVLGCGDVRVALDRHQRVPELGRASSGAAEDAPAEHDPASHPGADRQHHQVCAPPAEDPRRGPRPGPPRWRRCRRTPAPQGLAQDFAERDIGQRDVDRGDDAPGLELDDRGDSHTHGVQGSVAPRLADDLHQLPDQGVAASVQAGGLEVGFAEAAVL